MLISDVTFHSLLLLLVFSQHLTLKHWLYIIYLLIYLFIVPFLLECKLHEGRNLILLSAVSPAPRKGSGIVCIRWLLLLLLVSVKVTQSCQTLCDSLDYTVHGILQAKILDWVAFPFFQNGNHRLLI